MSKDKRPTIAIMAGNAESEYFNQLIAGFRNCAKEEDVNDFEYDVISAIADNNNVLFWHRNSDRKGFCLNGFINHYPDFIVRMKSGRTILVETKGDHLVNDDSLNKIKIGRKWADMSGPNYRYFMVFETKEVEGAITVKQLLQYLKDL